MEFIYMNNRTIVIARLEKFIETGKVVRPSRGLCAFVIDCQTEDSGRVTFSDLHDIFRTWEHFSGDELYPIKSPWYSSEGGYEYHVFGKYKGRKLKMRKLLAQHIINCLRED
jgi:hypothetical protein